MTSALDVALTRRYGRSLEQLRIRFGRLAANAWERLDSYDEAEVLTLAERLAPVTDAARRGAADLTAGYLGRVAGPTIGVTLDELAFDPAEAWRPPFISTWQAFKNGASYDDAREAGRRRSIGAAGNIVTDTARNTAGIVDGASPHIVGWRRTLNSPQPCDWCVSVAGQQYRTADSATFGHDWCHCTPSPITATADPGRLVNDDVVARLAAAAT